ncbi:MAG: peptide chain release factor 2 [Oscillospiraceae bacterium]|jgi:peptide chain release factor 2|nr:peptide chain release factor 2 [Oscillospiraceae bacterium]
MVQFEELKSELVSLKPQLESLKEAINIKHLDEEIKNAQEKSSFADFWDDPKNAQKILSKASCAKAKLSKFIALEKSYNDVSDLIEICNMEEDLSLVQDIKSQIKNISVNLENQITATLLTGEYDLNNAILTFHAGAGGTEAQDWVEMLYRMYSRFAERHGYKVKLLDYLDGEEAGLKSASILIEGENAYGYLKGESGVHRLVRISPFDSSGRRHTSFASIEAIPEIDDKINIEISPDDIQMDVFRASGAGGQHVNKTSSAVRLTHIPTGIVVACQNERSQHQNRDMAMKMLKSKLLEIKEREHLEKIEDIKGVQKEITWGSQIRSYIFMPYTLVKDHRTGCEAGNVSAVMDGEIDDFINSYLKFIINA